MKGRFLSRVGGRQAVCLVLVLWAAGAWALELYRSYWLYLADPWTEDAPLTWRMTTGSVERIEAFLVRTDPLLPPDSQVGILNDPGPESSRFFRCLWFAYFLPDARVRCSSDARSLPPSIDYWIFYGREPERVENFRRVYGSSDASLWKRLEPLPAQEDGSP